jgi:hypothetical protein
MENSENVPGAGRGIPTSQNAFSAENEAAFYDVFGQADSHTLLPQADSHTLPPPAPGKTWAEVRKRAILDHSLENTEDKGRINENNKEKDPSSSDDSKAEEDPPGSDHSNAEEDPSSSDDSKAEDNNTGKKRKNNKSQQIIQPNANKKRGSNKNVNDGNQEPKVKKRGSNKNVNDGNQRSESPLLPKEYENLEKLCDRLDEEATMGLCFRNLVSRKDKMGENAAHLLDKMRQIKKILNKYQNGPIINNGTTNLGEMLHEVGQQFDNIGENFAMARTEATGRDAEDSSCGTFAAEQSPTGNELIDNEAVEADADEEEDYGAVDFGNTDGISNDGQQLQMTLEESDVSLLSLDDDELVRNLFK